MNIVFADTFYWIALLNPKDRWHSSVVSNTRFLGGATFLTTDEVLTELLTFFAGSGPMIRQRVAGFVRSLFDDPQIKIIQQSRQSFLAGLELYERRLDKGYSLTDCISMHTMRQEEITVILTHDEHFAQEGFLALFRE